MEVEKAKELAWEQLVKTSAPSMEKALRAIRQAGREAERKRCRVIRGVVEEEVWDIYKSVITG